MSGGERRFVTTLMNAIERAFPDSFVWKPADSFNLGIPDIHAVVPPGKFIAAEVKQVPNLFSVDEYYKLFNERNLLRHTFTGPQISMLRRLAKAGANACGIVRVCNDLAFRINPSDIPIDGQMTPQLLFFYGQAFRREDDWQFWIHEGS